MPRQLCLLLAGTTARAAWHSTCGVASGGGAIYSSTGATIAEFSKRLFITVVELFAANNFNTGEVVRGRLPGKICSTTANSEHMKIITLL